MHFIFIILEPFGTTHHGLLGSWGLRWSSPCAIWKRFQPSSGMVMYVIKAGCQCFHIMTFLQAKRFPSPFHIIFFSYMIKISQNGHNYHFVALSQILLYMQQPSMTPHLCTKYDNIHCRIAFEWQKVLKLTWKMHLIVFLVQG